MTNLRTKLISLVATWTCLGALAFAQEATLEKQSALSLIEKVNDHWQTTNSPNVRAFWDNAAYFTGNMEAYRLTGNARYLEYADRWARHNQWQGAGEKDASKWKYKPYGEGQGHVLFGDWQICFQTYLDLNAIAPASYKIARAIEVMRYECTSSATDYWWWADALYMVMPVMTKLYKATGDEAYLDKLYANYCYADSLMFDQEEHLYYRDGKYIYPAHKTEAGKKDFWARGDGWVLAGLAKVLTDMPTNYCHRAFFEQRFCQLADAVSRCQQPEGYWTRSMLDSEQADGPETSGTAFFTYGLLWGMNHGYLDRAKYEPVVRRAWTYLTTVALQPDGSVGYVQPIGEKAIKGQQLTARNVANFGTGAFLLAACEKVRFDDGSVTEHGTSFDVTITNLRSDFAEEVVELDAATVFARLGISGGRQFIVTDSRGKEQPYQLTHDGKLLLCVAVHPQGSTTVTIKKGVPADYAAACYGRQYPERLDDIAWENDRAAYRLYGPALQQRGEDAYGNDVWTKSTTALVCEDRYRTELLAEPEIARLRTTDRAAAEALNRCTSYHLDHGNGLDCYNVGPTLGCGAPALLVADELVYPYCYEQYQILDNGPLRFTVSLTYAAKAAGTAGDSVVEHRIVSLDKGSNYGSTTVSYDGLTRSSAFATGVVLHTADTQSVRLGRNYVVYADPTDSPTAQDGVIYVGAILPVSSAKTKRFDKGNEKRGIAGHALCTLPKYDGHVITYYYGSAWSKNDCRSLDEWELRTRNFLESLSQPLQVKY